MVKSYEKQNKSKADIAKENKKKNLEKASGGGGIHAGKSKDKIAKEKSFVAKQKVKEAKKAPTKSEKKDLDATPKRESTAGGIHAGKPSKVKGIDVEIKEKPKKDASGGIHAGKPEKKHKKDKDHKGPIIKIIEKIIGKNGKAEAAVIGKGGKSPGPKEKKKLSGMSAKEKARIAKKKADAKAAATREEGRKPKKKEAEKQAETGTKKTSYEARVKALVAKKASLSKKETADGRSEYQVEMNKLKKENKKAWKKMFKGGKLKK